MAEHKQYVNLDPSQPDQLKEIPPERAGRTIKVVAQVNPKKQGVTVCFEIKVGRDNLVQALDDANFSPGERAYLQRQRLSIQGLGAPGRAKRRAKTDAEGKATMEFYLSEFGGDEFEIVAYLPRKGGGKGPELTSDKYVVWRRVYYQTSRFMSGAKGAGRTGTLAEIPPLDMGPVITEFEARKHNIELVDDGGQDLITRRCNVLEKLDDYKKSAKEGYDGKREPVAMRIVLVNQIAQSAVQQVEFPVVKEGETVKKQVPHPHPLWLDESLALNADWLVKAEWRRSAKDRTWKDLDPAYVKATGSREIEIAFAKIPKKHIFDFSRKAEVRVKYRHRKSSSNGASAANAIWIANEIMWHGARTAGEKQQTMIHEVGHFIGLVPAGQSTQYTGKGHQGGHCHTGLSPGELGDASYVGKSGTCIMFGENAPSRTGTFCGTCDPSVRTAKVKILGMPPDW